MPDIPKALLSFGELIGVIDAKGSPDWSWFGDPKARTLTTVSGLAQRPHVGAFFRALRGLPDGADTDFIAAQKLVWEPFQIGPVNLGLVWNKDGDGLRLGVGAKGTFPVSSQQFPLSLRAGLFKVQTSGVDEDLAFGASGAFPVPAFLTSLGVELSLSQLLATPKFIVALSASATIDAVAQARALSFDTSAAQPKWDVLAWDCARAAVFVVEAWTDKQSGEFFKRIDDHLFLAVSPPDFAALPPFDGKDKMGQAPDFAAWPKAVISTQGDGKNALTVLWHLRALLTGNEDPGFLKGSYFFKLAGAPSTGVPPTLASAVQGKPPAAEVGAWLGITDDAADPNFVLVLEIHPSANNPLPLIKLAQVNKSTFALTRPNMTAADAAAIGTALAGGLPIGNETITIETAGAERRVELFKEILSGTGVPLLEGYYKLQLALNTAAPNPVAFRGVTPIFPQGLTLPPPKDLNALKGAAKDLLSGLVKWLLQLAEVELKKIDLGTQELGSSFKLPDLLPPAAAIIQEVLKAGPPNFATVAPQLIGVVGNMANAWVQSALDGSSPLSVTFPGGHIKPELAIGPITEESFYIGKITAGAELDVASAFTGSPKVLVGARVGIVDFRLGKVSDGDGLVGSLLPDFRETNGFTLSVDVVKGTVEGSGKIPIQKSIGPLDLAALLVDVRPGSFTLGIDLSFELGPIRVLAHELGVQFFFQDDDDTHHDAGEVVPFLGGLGLSMDTSVLKLSGAFLKQNGDYLGGATVAVVGYFELSAIGGYGMFPKDPKNPGAGEASSLFLFASLVAPLGGPPYFFITGIAGGFGYNRLLPPAGPIADHPFMQTMRGEVTLDTLGGQFVFAYGTNWVAAGIQFRSFGFIEGKIVVAAQFGNEFVFQLLGLATFAIEPLVYFEIGIEARADAESLQLKAGISPNSYLLHPDVFSLRGDFGLYVFYGGPHSGDFVLSIGGYHPLYAKPEHYPDLNRVGVKATLYGFIRLSVECFFVCTPQALMAGASVSLSAEFEGIGCGLDVYIDVFIRWEPFFIQGSMGIALWFEFCGRHEISVDLEIHTPPLGGTATIDLMLVSFDIDFGAHLDTPPPPGLHEFFTRQLGVPATPILNNKGAKVATFNTADKAGLLRLDFLYGRPAEKDQQQQTSEQEGIKTPVPVAPEFAFAVRTRLPFDEPGEIHPDAQPAPALVGKVNVPLCTQFCLTSVLKVSAASITLSRRVRLVDIYPAATFGDEATVDAQPEARSNVSGVDPAEATVALSDGIEFHYEALLDPKPETVGVLSGLEAEGSEPSDEYPLPLGPSKQPQKQRGPKETHVFSAEPLVAHLDKKKRPLARRALALQRLQSRKPAPLHITTRTADLQRFTNLAGSGISTVANPPGGTATVNVPGSPVRRREMFGVNLRVVPPRAPVPLQRQRLQTLSLPRNLRRGRLTPPAGTAGPFEGPITIEAGKATWIDLNGGAPKRGTLTFSGQQTVRAIFLGGGDEFIADAYVTGSKSMTGPARTRRAVFIGEGMSPPVGAIPGMTGAVATPVALENIGIEHDSVLLALGRGVFAGHGCVAETRVSLELAPDPLDSVPGFDLLRAATQLRLHFPPVRPGWSLVLTVQPILVEPRPAIDDIRWRSLDAKLSALHTVIAPDDTAFLMTVEATKPWSLELDFGRAWRLAGAVLTARSPAVLARSIAGKVEWDMIDDRFQPPPAGTSTKLTMQIVQ